MNSSKNQMVSPFEDKQFCAPVNGEVILCGEQQYRLGTVIAQGAFGVVFECSDQWDNNLVAKVFKPANRSYDEVKNLWLRELNALHELRHPNITFVHAAFEYKYAFYLIIERCALTIKDLIQTPNRGSGEIWIPHVARDVLQALHYIHENGYVHKDIHSGNVFVSMTADRMFPTQPPVMSFKVGDLGISNLESQIFPLNTLLAEWMLPPEYLNPGDFGTLGKSVDIYHAGLLFLSILMGVELSFSVQDVLDGKPRQIAESWPSPFAPAVAKALRRHVSSRTSSAIEFWHDIQACRDSSSGWNSAG